MAKDKTGSKPRKSSTLSDSDNCSRVVEILKSVAHPVRLRIIALLCEAEQHVGALAGEIGASQATISQQLRILRMNRLVEVTRTGGFAIYRLAEPRLRELVRCMVSCCSAEPVE